MIVEPSLTVKDLTTFKKLSNLLIAN